MTVVYASPGKLLRLTGAIGPLQEAALAGTMTWNLLQAGGGTTVELIYTVGGFRAGGFRDIPTVVDGVLRGQLARLKALVETGRPDPSASPGDTPCSQWTNQSTAARFPHRTAVRISASQLQRAQEVEEILLLILGQALEIQDHPVGL